MARKSGLGKGLEALLGNIDNINNDDFHPVMEKSSLVSRSADVSNKKSKDIVQLDIEKLVSNPGQPRKNFDEGELQELAASIKEYGVIQPVIAANAGDGSYIIIAGERRTRAAKLAGLKTVPVIIREYTDQRRLEISLIENIQRTDLNPIEEAAAYKNLMDYSSLSQDELAVRLGKNRSTIANSLRLLKLPVDVQKSIEQGKVSPGHARALLSISDIKAREILYKDILTKDISVREAEKRAASGADKSKKKKPAAINKKRPPEIGAMAEKFIGRLGTKVVIEGDLNKGRIQIDYYSMEDLERLYEILGG